jgi:hypothetical protein
MTGKGAERESATTDHCSLRTEVVRAEEIVQRRQHWALRAFLPSALNVKVEDLDQLRVNGGSKYDSFSTTRLLSDSQA